MNFDFSEDQLMLKEQANRFLREQSLPQVAREILESDDPYDTTLWQSIIELGWLGVAIPEQYGGLGAGYLELCILAEELGRALAPVPFSSSIYLAAEALLLGGDEKQRAEYLPRLASGVNIGTLALAEGVGTQPWGQLQTTASGGASGGESGVRINGIKTPVADGMAADIAIVTAQGEQGLGLYLVDLQQAAVQRELQPSVDESRPQATLRFTDAEAEKLGGSTAETLDLLLDRAAVLFAFEQLGGAQACIDMGRDYVVGRYAFGRPIGSFQAIKHKLATMYGEYELARSNCFYAAWALAENPALAENHPELAKAAAAARLNSSKAYFYCAKENIQVHGGIGFTWEYDAHLHYRRAKLLSLIIGGERRWEERLLSALERELKVS